MSFCKIVQYLEVQLNSQFVVAFLAHYTPHGACGGWVPGLACHKGSVNGKSSYSHIGRNTKKI